MFRYTVLHIPTGRKESASAKFANKEKFLEQLNTWNQKYPGTYQYWA